MSVGYTVDLYLVLAYDLSDEHEKLLRSRLPTSVGLEFWNSATPYFTMESNKNRIRQIPKSLARQHRFVVKDKLFFYDMFVAMEDDMLVHGEQVQYHLQLSEQIDRLKSEAPESMNLPPGVLPKDVFYGNLTNHQVSHLWPGFLRTEVLQEGSVSQEVLDEIPVDTDSTEVNATVCCRMPREPNPSGDSLLIWETGIAGISVREISGLGWVVYLQGPPSYFVEENPSFSGSYFAYDDYNLTRRPILYPHKQFMGQTGGWMATRKQLLDLHLDLCQGGFFPPFYRPNFFDDGLSGFNSGVENWSGGIQMWTSRCGCNMQRIIPLADFSTALVYHTANNKQRSIKEHRRVLAKNLLGQLNTLVKLAKRAKQLKLGR